MPDFIFADAQPIPRLTVPGPHPAYRDAEGKTLMWCYTTLSGGGIAVNESARDWLEGQDGPKFVRLTNSATRLDEVLPLERVPFGPRRNGQGGAYFPVDVGSPQLTPMGEIPF